MLDGLLSAVKWLQEEDPAVFQLVLASVELAAAGAIAWALLNGSFRLSHRTRALGWLTVLALPLASLLLGLGAPLFQVSIPVLSAAEPAMETWWEKEGSGLAPAVPAPAQPIQSFSPAQDAVGASQSVPAAPLASASAQANPVDAPAAAPLAVVWAWLPGPLIMLRILYLSAVAVGVSWWLVNKVRLSRFLARSRPASNATHRVYRHAAKDLGLLHRRLPRLRVVAHTGSPAIAGLFRPVIVVPAWLDGTGLDRTLWWVLRHELTHWRAGDLWSNALRTLSTTLFFFHPVVWWAGRHWSMATELACDRQLVRSPGDARTYAQELLELVDMQLTGSHRLVPTGLYASRSQLGSRIHTLATTALSVPSRLSRGARLALMAAVCGVLLVGISQPRVESRQRDSLLPVQLPEARALGVLYHRPESAGPDGNWYNLGPARGLVRVPRTGDLKLRAHGLSAFDLNSLAPLVPAGLTHLDLTHVPISNSSLDALARHRALRWVSFEGAGLKDEQLAATQAWNQLEQLEEVRFTYCPLEGWGLGVLHDLKNLRYLDLSANAYLAEGGLAPLRGHPTVEILKLQASKLDSTAGEVAATLPMLHHLDLSHTAISDGALAPLAGHPQLAWLKLSSTAIAPAALAYVGMMPGLEVLDLKKTTVSGGFQLLSGLGQLTHLALRQADVNDGDLYFLGQMPSLKSLRLELTQVGDAGAAHLMNLPRLETLSLTGTQVTDAGVAQLARLPQLTNLRCSADGVSTEARRRFTTSLNAQLKVGVLYSQETAAFFVRQGHDKALHAAACMASDILNNQGFATFAVIEPGSEGLGCQPETLNDDGLTHRTIVANTPADLMQLDVLVVWAAYDMDPQVVRCIEAAQQEGLGVVTFSRTGGQEENNPEIEVARLLGISGESEYAWLGNTREFLCTVVEEHPILAGWERGQVFPVETLDGWTDVANGEPLLREAYEVHPLITPLYVRDLGQGRGVHCQWYDFPRVDPPYTPEEFFRRRESWREEFVARTVQWAAGFDAPMLMAKHRGERAKGSASMQASGAVIQE